MEQKGTQTSHQQSGGDIKTSQNWNQNGGTEHRKGVLDAQYQHTGNSELASIVDADFTDFNFFVVAHR